MIQEPAKCVEYTEHGEEHRKAHKPTGQKYGFVSFGHFISPSFAHTASEAA